DRQPVVLTVSNVVYRDIAAFNVPRISQSFPKRCEESAGWRKSTEIADHRHRRLLRLRRKRPCNRRAAEERNELTPFQLIKLHSVPCQQGPNCRISNWRGSVSGSGSLDHRPHL